MSEYPVWYPNEYINMKIRYPIISELECHSDIQMDWISPISPLISKGSNSNLASQTRVVNRFRPPGHLSMASGRSQHTISVQEKAVALSRSLLIKGYYTWGSTCWAEQDAHVLQLHPFVLIKILYGTIITFGWPGHWFLQIFRQTALPIFWCFGIDQICLKQENIANWETWLTQFNSGYCD